MALPSLSFWLLSEAQGRLIYSGYEGEFTVYMFNYLYIGQTGNLERRLGEQGRMWSCCIRRSIRRDGRLG